MYVNGHSDMVGGVVVVDGNRELGDRLVSLQNAGGAISCNQYSIRQGERSRHVARASAAHFVDFSLWHRLHGFGVL